MKSLNTKENQVAFPLVGVFDSLKQLTSRTANSFSLLQVFKYTQALCSSDMLHVWQHKTLTTSLPPCILPVRNTFILFKYSIFFGNDTFCVRNQWDFHSTQTTLFLRSVDPKRRKFECYKYGQFRIKYKLQQKLILSAISHSVCHEATRELNSMLSSVQKHLALPILPKCLYLILQ